MTKNLTTTCYITEFEADDPASQDFISYWRAKRGDRFAPAWADISLLDYTPSTIPYMAVVNVCTNPLDFIYRFWGTGHVSTKNLELTGHSVLDHAPVEVGRVIFDEYEKVLELKGPVFILDHSLQSSPDTPLVQTTTRLPLSNDGKTVTNVISYCNLHNRSSEWQKTFEQRSH